MLVHVPKLTNRIGYTLNVVMDNLLHCPFEITTDPEAFLAHEGPRLCYGPERLGDGAVWIKSTQLLFQTNVEEQEAVYTECDGLPALFPVYGRGLDFRFDLLAAVFYMVSRYEEYLPHRTDAHGRFTPQESVALREGFLRRPVVDLWARLLAERLEQRFEGLRLAKRSFAMEVTVDIDAAYCYRGKGFWRSFIGYGKDLFRERSLAPLRERWRCRHGRQEDPFNTFDAILALKERHPDVGLIFFALLADYGPFDKNISHHNEEFRQLLKHLSDYEKVGLHTSYASYSEPQRIELEASRLYDIIHHRALRSRAHFLRLALPHSYRELQRYGIRHDYTMGYADEPGFRAGISVPYPFYDLGKDAEQDLTIHPLCLMDVTLKKTLKLSNLESLELYRSMMDEVAAAGGTFSCIFHNQYLCDRFGWNGWKEVFDQVWEYGSSLKSNNL